MPLPCPPSTCACTIKAGIQHCGKRQLRGRTTSPLRTARASPAHCGAELPLPWEEGKGRQDRVAFTSVERWGDSCRAAVVLGCIPALQTLPSAPQSTLKAGCHLWRSSFGQGIAEIILTCTVPHPAFLRRGDTTQGVTPVPASSTRSEFPK